MARWIRFTEEINALDDLEKTFFFIQQTKRDKAAWKWVILSVYSALYGFAICALRGTNSQQVTRGRKLIDFSTAIARCQDSRYMNMTIASKALQLDTDEKDSIERLAKDLRNNFIHYMPKLWSIEISGLPKIMIHCLDAIRFLALESGNYMHLSKNQERKVRSLVFQSKKILSRY